MKRRAGGAHYERVKKSSGQGAAVKTVLGYGEPMQRSHGDFFTRSARASGWRTPVLYSIQATIGMQMNGLR